MSYNAAIENYSNLRSRVSQDLLSSETWDHSGRLHQSGDTPEMKTEKYREHFRIIDSLLQNERTRARTKRRFEFVAAHYHSLLTRDMFLRQQMASVNTRAMLSAIVWQSRNEAHRVRNIDVHPSLAELAQHPALKANPRPAEREIKAAITVGSFVIGINSRDKRRKWVAPSVDQIFDNWLAVLTEYIVRVGVMSQWGDLSRRASDKRAWVEDLGMSDETFELTISMDWDMRSHQKKGLHLIESGGRYDI